MTITTIALTNSQYSNIKEIQNHLVSDEAEYVVWSEDFEAYALKRHEDTHYFYFSEESEEYFIRLVHKINGLSASFDVFESREAEISNYLYDEDPDGEIFSLFLKACISMLNTMLEETSFDSLELNQD